MVRMPQVETDAGAKMPKVESANQSEEQHELETERLLLEDNPHVQSYALLVVGPSGDVSLLTSSHVEPYAGKSALNFSGSTLRDAHETALRRMSGRQDRYPSRSNVSRIASIKKTAGSAQLAKLLKGERQQTRESPLKRGRPPKALPPPREQSVSLDLDDESVQTAKAPRLVSFFMHESEKVKTRLGTLIQEIHQLSDKKIAKAWIKGICPKKQAKFPYSDKKREHEHDLPPRVPGWWPPTSLCKFVEPDHVDRNQRNALLLHLLQVRPTPAQLQEWNGDDREPNPTHAHAGWTAFLKELAPIDFVDDVLPNDPQRVKRRRERLAELYELAELEEQYQNEGMDLIYQCAAEGKPTTLKRPRRPASDKDVSEDSAWTMPRSESPVRTHAAAKRPRLESEGRAIADSARRAKHMPTFPVATLESGIESEDLLKHKDHPMTGLACTTSFDSNTSMASHMQGPDAYSQPLGHCSTFPGRPDWAFPSYVPQPQPQPTMQVRRVTHVPEPQADTVPNTPMDLMLSTSFGMAQPGMPDMTPMSSDMHVSQQHDFYGLPEYIDPNHASMMYSSAPYGQPAYPFPQSGSHHPMGGLPLYPTQVGHMPHGAVPGMYQEWQSPQVPPTMGYKYSGHGSGDQFM